MAASNRETLTKVYEAINSGNLNELDKYIDPGCVEHSPDPMVPTDKKGPEVVKEIISFYRKGFPDLKFNVKHFVEEGDMLVAHLEITGTHSGDLMGMPPTNKPVKVEGFDMVKFANGKAIEHWGVTDTAALMQQIGMGPK
ncbi:ester cyclase [Botryobacter ruber]|uniref:ester cyclase n=1 Tax=Botryobacter ruber TaxID=2171629 RepID=UPI000E0C63C9|nr:ester cyclase [Botryobacter ruber]